MHSVLECLSRFQGFCTMCDGEHYGRAYPQLQFPSPAGCSAFRKTEKSFTTEHNTEVSDKSYK